MGDIVDKINNILDEAVGQEGQIKKDTGGVLSFLRKKH